MPQRGDSSNFEDEVTERIDLGTPTYHYPITGTPKRVQAVVVDELQVIDAGPRLTPEEWQAWRTAKQPRGVSVVNSEPNGPPGDEASEPLAESDQMPREQEVAKLPRWARVAFAARCARRVLPLFTSGFDGYQDALNTVHRAVCLAEISASEGRAHPEAANYAEAARDIYRKVGFDAGITQEHHFVAVLAARAARLVNEQVPVIEAWKDAQIPLIYRDYAVLRCLADEFVWTDETPVPPTVFGPLWPDGMPTGWPADENANREIELTIDLPDNASDADVKRYVELLVSKADDVYRAGGGNGLKISGLDITGDKLAEKPTPTSGQPGDAELVGGEAT